MLLHSEFLKPWKFGVWPWNKGIGSRRSVIGVMLQYRTKKTIDYLPPRSFCTSIMDRRYSIMPRRLSRFGNTAALTYKVSQFDHLSQWTVHGCYSRYPWMQRNYLTLAVTQPGLFPRFCSNFEVCSYIPCHWKWCSFLPPALKVPMRWSATQPFLDYGLGPVVLESLTTPYTPSRSIFVERAMTSY